VLYFALLQVFLDPRKLNSGIRGKTIPIGGYQWIIIFEYVVRIDCMSRRLEDIYKKHFFWTRYRWVSSSSLPVRPWGGLREARQ
jgi:hypothetical protein